MGGFEPAMFEEYRRGAHQKLRYWWALRSNPWGNSPVADVKKLKSWFRSQEAIFDLLTIGRVVPRYGERLIRKWREVGN